MGKVGAVIQARMGSTRLPGKVMADVCGRSMLQRVVDRVARARRIDKIIVATTNRPMDDEIVETCERHGIACYRGSEDDVLDRYYQTAKYHRLDFVVRITSDCPLVDPNLVDEVTSLVQTSTYLDYVSNILNQRTFPRGLDVEAMKFESLERAWKEDVCMSTREHVTPYIWTHPELFSMRGVILPVDLSRHRWTVDTKEDLHLVREVYRYTGNDTFSWQDVLQGFDTHPEWFDYNSEIEQKAILV